MATTKVCTKCNEEKGFGEFYKDKTKSTGLSSQCKNCCGKKKLPVHTASTKVCTKCNEEKGFGEFYKAKRGKYGLRSQCKMCCAKNNLPVHTASTKVCRICNEEKELSLMAKKANICKSCLRIKKKEHYEANKEEIKQQGIEYREANKEEIKQKKKESYEKNKEEINKKNWQYKKKRIAEDPLFKLLEGLRTRIRIAIKSQAGEKAEKTMELLGCSVQYVRDHLESQFTEGMTWENYGEWHIDHIRPCASFNLEDPEEQKKCFHWTNLQPLWAADNFAKSDRLDWVKT